MEQPKKLYKNKATGKLEGVCSGIAEYFNADPTLVRLLWVIVSLISCGTGIVGYIIFAIVMPDKSKVYPNDSNNDNYKNI